MGAGRLDPFRPLLAGLAFAVIERRRGLRLPVLLKVVTLDDGVGDAQTDDGVAGIPPLADVEFPFGEIVLHLGLLLLRCRIFGGRLGIRALESGGILDIVQGETVALGETGLQIEALGLEFVLTFLVFHACCI